MKPRSKPEDETREISQFGGYSAVARMIGVNPDTLRSAVRFGKLAGHRLGDGSTPVVRISDARAWAKKKIPTD